MTLVNNRMNKLRYLLEFWHPAEERKTLQILTKRFRSSFLTSGFTPTRFLNILAIRSSRKMTISCSQNFIRHGFEAKWILGIRDLRRAVKEDRRGLRGSTELTVMSSGPGTRTKCVVRVITGYDAIRSARESKLSRRENKAITRINIGR